VKEKPVTVVFLVSLFYNIYRHFQRETLGFTAKKCRLASSRCGRSFGLLTGRSDQASAASLL